MSKSVNKVILLGNVGKDPEIKATGSGTMVANFTLATSDRQKDQQGNWQEKTEWHSLVAFARTAELIRDYVTKGSKIYVEGKLQTRSWDQNGEKKYRTEVVIDDLSLLSGREGAPVPPSGHSNAPRTATRQERATPAPQTRSQAPADPFDSDSEPF